MNANESQPHGFSPVPNRIEGPRETIDTIIRRGNPDLRGLRPYIEALAYARWQQWSRIEAEQYIKLSVLLDREHESLDEDVAQRLANELAHAHVEEDPDLVVRVMLQAVSRVAPESPTLADFVRTFERYLDRAGMSWQARLRSGQFIDRVGTIDPQLAEVERDRLTMRLTEWALEYQMTDAAAGLDLRSRGVFAAIGAASWADAAAENVARGIDGAFACALDKLMTAGRMSWFEPFVRQLADDLAGRQLYRRLSNDTLFAVAERIAETRRNIYDHFPSAALAVTELEEAIHRPHRLRVDRTSMRLELEVPGPRGFACPEHGRGGDGRRLRVFDISRDGCLAVIDAPATFEETAPGAAFTLDRGHGRTYEARRLTGVIRNNGSSVTIGPNTPLVLRDTLGEGREWATIDGASVVRCATDPENNRLWLGFHFDRMIPEVAHEIEQFVYNAA